MRVGGVATAAQQFPCTQNNPDTRSGARPCCDRWWRVVLLLRAPTRCLGDPWLLEVRASVSTQLRFRHTDARRLGQSPADGLRLLPPAAASVDDARKCSACVAAGAADTRLPVGTLTPCAAVFIGQRAQGCSQLAARAAATTVKSLARGRYIFPRILNEKCCVKTLYYCNSPLAATRGICEQGELQTACCMAAGDAAHD